MKKVHGYDYHYTAGQFVLYCSMLLAERIEACIKKSRRGPQPLLEGGFYRCFLCEYGAHSFQKHHAHMKRVHMPRTEPLRCLGPPWFPIILKLKENIAITLGDFLNDREDGIIMKRKAGAYV
jgi:hypothetical protein